MSGISTELERQIRDLITQGQKLAAIKLYREMTGIGLAEAKDAVEAIERGESVDFLKPIQPNASIEEQIKQLLAKRQKIQAVILYREAYHCELKEAKDAVDTIEVKMQREARTSLPSNSAISNDPFAEDTQRNRRFLFFLLAIVLLVITGAVFLTGYGP